MRQTIPMKKAFPGQTHDFVTSVTAKLFMRYVRIKRKRVHAAGTRANFFRKNFQVSTWKIAHERRGGIDDLEIGEIGR